MLLGPDIIPWLESIPNFQSKQVCRNASKHEHFHGVPLMVLLIVAIHADWRLQFSGRGRFIQASVHKWPTTCFEKTIKVKL